MYSVCESVCNVSYAVTKEYQNTKFSAINIYKLLRGHVPPSLSSELFMHSFLLIGIYFIRISKHKFAKI